MRSRLGRSAIGGRSFSAAAEHPDVVAAQRERIDALLARPAPWGGAEEVEIDPLETQQLMQPVPDVVGINGFAINDVSVLENGAGPDTTNAIRFFMAFDGGGFNTIGLSTGTEALGAQLFSGTTAAPTFLDGVYVLLDSTGARLGTLTITSSIPEPSAALVFAAGLLLVSRRTRAHASH